MPRNKDTSEQPREEKKKSKGLVLSTISIVVAAIATVIACATIIYVSFGMNTGKTPDTVPSVYDERLIYALDKLRDMPVDEISSDRIILTFDSMCDEETLGRILDLLNQYNIRATFFVSGMHAAEFPDSVRMIKNGGHDVGNYTLTAERSMHELSAEDCISDILRAEEILKTIMGVRPTKLRFYVTAYTDLIYSIARATDYILMPADVFLNYRSFSSLTQVQGYVNALPDGTIVSIKLSGELDETEYFRKEIIDRPAIDPEPAAPDIDKKEEEAEKKRRLIQVVEWFCIALSKASVYPEAEILQVQNKGELATPIRVLGTTEKSVAYLFYGLGNQRELDNVLLSLKELNAKATFFVSKEDLDENPDQIKQIIAEGHAVGIAVLPSLVSDYGTTCYEILTTSKRLAAEFDYKNTKNVMLPWGEVQDYVLEAVNALGLRYISYDKAIFTQDTLNAADAQGVIDISFGVNDQIFVRGQTLYFRLNLFPYNNRMVGDVLTLLEGTKNFYAIKTIDEIMDNPQCAYKYPLSDVQILPQVLNRVAKNELKRDVGSLAAQYYIGNPDIVGENNLPGFTSYERENIDSKGLIRTDEKAVFLTFDDWGTDENINKLLEVLEKHNAKATFFVRTEYVSANPNLLRAIGMGGHDICSHTHTHYPLSIGPEENWSYSNLSEKEGEALMDDIITSYKVLQSIVGDLLNEDGKPVLTRIFRPPTMAVSKVGLQTVFSAGFTYAVNGSYSAKDYAATSAEELYRNLKNNIKDGSVVILHMSDNSIYTADALDMFLTDNEQKSEENRFVFRRLSDYLDGTYRVNSSY